MNNSDEPTFELWHYKINETIIKVLEAEGQDTRRQRGKRKSEELPVDWVCFPTSRLAQRSNWRDCMIQHRASLVTRSPSCRYCLSRPRLLLLYVATANGLNFSYEGRIHKLGSPKLVLIASLRGTVFRELHKLYKQHACREYLENWPELVKYCGYREDNIPQLQDLNLFLKRKTGFQLRPVAGYLSPRDFLAGLAFRVFHCTQYIRHSSDPYYTPEPDCCHELLGHMPLLANPSFAQFSQELGLTSLGASDGDVEKLATLYFFTVEFGLCKQDGQLRVYGAGLLSSVAELKHAVAASDKIKRFDPEVTVHEECIITAFQNHYYYTDSFQEATEKMRAFANTIQRPFGVRYNPYTQSVEVLTNAQKIAAIVSELRGDLCIVSNALRKIHEHDETVDVESIEKMLQSGLQLNHDEEEQEHD
ncbi:Tryptophan 5-hydroxylase 1 [Homalodisca vitripennis]|nr:Tryptophan 5-hydroxylase 1 [Homalodisca vitripennis]